MSALDGGAGGGGDSENLIKRLDIVIFYFVPSFLLHRRVVYSLTLTKPTTQIIRDTWCVAYN